MRIIISNHTTDEPVAAHVTLSLLRMVSGKPEGPALSLLAATTDAMGMLEAHFKTPKTKPGDYELKIDVTSELG